MVFLFRVNTTAGLIGALVTVAGLPLLFVLGVKIWPNTPIARMLSLEMAQRAADDRITSPIEGGAATQQLIGVHGKALTDLRPVGTCLLNGQRAECLAEGGMIRAGTPVVVVSADGMHIKVREDEQA